MRSTGSGMVLDVHERILSEPRADIAFTQYFYSNSIKDNKIILTCTQHENRDLRKIKVGLNLFKVGYLTLHHELNFLRGNRGYLYTAIRKCNVKLA